MKTVAEGLEELSSALGSIWADAVDSFSESLSDAWTAVVFGLYVTVAAGLGLLGRQRAQLRLSSAPPVATAVIALAIATLDGAALRWTLVLPGIWLIGVGVLSTWGSDIHERFVTRRRVARIWLESWVLWATGTRNAKEFGFVAMVIGFAMAGGEAFHAVAAGLAIAPQLRRLVRREASLRKSGEASKYSPLLWRPMVTLAILGGVILAACTGALLDRYYSWIDTSPPSEGPLVLQALLAAEIAIASLSAAAVGLAVQLRASSFGSDLAFSQLRRNRLTASFASLMLLTIATVYVLGNWHEAMDPAEGIYPSLVVHGGLVTCAWAIAEASLAVISLARVRSVADSVSRLALVNDWQYQMSLYGWNAHRRGYGPSPASQTPESVHLLIQAVQGSFRIGDLELLEDVIMAWVSNAETQPAIWQFESFAQTVAEWEEKWFNTDLGASDADCLDGVDIALAQVVRNVSAIPEVRAQHVRAVIPLGRLSYPPFAKGRKNHEVRLFDSELPGFRTLIELTAAAARVNDGAAVEWLLQVHWRSRSRLAIRWAERLTPVEEINGRWPTLPFAERLFEVLGGYAEISSRGTSQSIRDTVVWVIIEVVMAGDSCASMREGLSKVYDVVNFDDDTLWHRWDDLNKIALKPNADDRWLLSIVERSVARTIKLEGRESAVSFGLNDFFELGSTLSHAILRPSERERNGRGRDQREPRLAATIWALTEWAIERSEQDKAGVTYWLSRWAVQNQLREFLVRCSQSVAWRVADAGWDWAAERPKERAWLALWIDGPWLRDRYYWAS